MSDPVDGQARSPHGSAPTRRALARLLLSTLDLTRLEDEADDSEVRALCRRGDTAFGTPAAVCVYPRFLAAARDELETLNLAGTVSLATVVNFPRGAAEPERAAAETRQAIALGADEIDAVLPWKALRLGDDAVGQRLVEQCRAAAPGKILKVILETGMLSKPELVRRAAAIAIGAGADFIKTSTGKTEIGATQEAVSAMLETIVAHDAHCGIKISGGVRTIDEAIAYLELAAGRLGREWIDPARFRIGASSLLDDLLAVLDPPAENGR